MSKALGPDYCGPGCRGLCPCPEFKRKVVYNTDEVVRRAIEYDPENKNYLSNYWKDMKFVDGEWKKDA